MRHLQKLTCKLCGEVHPSNGLHTHLKWKHNKMTTEQYMERFGDFRANTEKAEKLKLGKPLYKCQLCNDDKTYTRTALTFHLIKKHKTDKEDYILNTILKGIQPVCQCGCRKSTALRSYDEPHSSAYLPGHNKATLGFSFSKGSRQKMSISAVERLNRNRVSGTKPAIHQRKCVFDRVFGTLENYKSKLVERGVECLSSEVEIRSDGVPLRFRCLETKREFTQLKLDSWSPYRVKVRSRAQAELVAFIKDILPQEVVLENTHKVLDDHKEIDVFLPGKKIGIEFDGLYYHAELSGGKTAEYHRWKTENALTKGVRLVHVFEDEWNNKKELVMSKLRSILGIREPKRVFARNCTIGEVTPAAKNAFLQRNHIQGSDNASVKLGLYHDKELVAVMTFSPPNVTKGKAAKDAFIELNRYATSCNVIGGAGKLLKHFITHNHPIRILTYADLRWTSGASNMYSKLGFSPIGQTKCNYFYLDGSGRRLHRFNFTKAKLVEEGGDPSKTEWQLMQERGYDRIWDCGHLRYEMVVSH
jgi:hypothetical protein